MSDISEIDSQMARGEFLRAADHGAQLLAEQPSEDEANLEAVWLTGLALARCGAIGSAELLLSRTKALARAGAPSPQHQKLLTLDARLSKDRALLAIGTEQASLAKASASKYQAVADHHASYYAAVNAATMWLVAGDRPKSREYATLARSLALDGMDESDRYWRLVTAAEAELVLGNPSRANDHLRDALAESPDWSTRATTIRQQKLVCQLTGVPVASLVTLPQPAVLHYTGHLFSTGPEADLAAAIDTELNRLKIGAAYGALACGADIIVAERVKNAGLELHVRLPCLAEQFVTRSVEPGGNRWVQRFWLLLESADSVTVENTGSLEDDTAFAFGNQLSMGDALLRAAALESSAYQMALWDGDHRGGEASTAKAIRDWERTGNRTIVIDTNRSVFPPVQTPAADPEDGRSEPVREIRSILFVDILGFSRMGEAKLHDFFTEVMPVLARVLDDFGTQLLYRNTWGDSLYLVFSNADSAVECALRIQEALTRLRQTPSWEGLLARIGGHSGPVYAGRDPVLNAPTFYGTHVVRTARIEPRTPPGEVFVTGDMASLLARSPRPAIRLEYVGRVPADKDYGSFPMFLARRYERSQSEGSAPSGR